MSTSSRPVIACVGAGRMGRGIAHAFAYAGHEVRLLDAKQRDAASFDALQASALAEVENSLRSLATLGQFDPADVATLLGRVTIHQREAAADALRGAPFVFEAVPETEAAKRDAFALIDAAADADAVIASTTSTFLSTLIASYNPTPERVLNAHWLNPAYLVPLVEVSPHDGTSADILARLMALLEGAGKVPVVCKASPGYIVPRIQALAMNEAARLVEEGVATAEDVDRAVRYGFGFRFAVLGLLEFIDWGGGDILHYASRYMAGAMADPRFAAPEIVTSNMAAGRTGMRAGQGFYDWSSRDPDAFRQEKLGEFLRLLALLGQTRPPVI